MYLCGHVCGRQPSRVTSEKRSSIRLPDPHAILKRRNPTHIFHPYRYTSYSKQTTMQLLAYSELRSTERVLSERVSNIQARSIKLQGAALIADGDALYDYCSYATRVLYCSLYERGYVARLCEWECVLTRKQ
jgi:hypothetical protein